MATTSAAANTTPESTPVVLADERTQLLGILAEQRDTLLITVRGLDDERAARRTTVSELTLGGLIKHVARTEAFWVRLMRERDGLLLPGDLDEERMRLSDGETLDGMLAEYAAVAEATEAAVAALPDLDVAVPLPDFPWAPSDEPVYWSARRVLLHLLRETAHHCGHADIIRESLDGANTTMQMAG
ncbi:DinB family protein [Allostreptomyces psammosilenae]|uniref:Putative damage-inducible protein DinB n=1 Tax=Allostreptomyces psammosilenae TaxID=1892865 RepID=A0A852ZZ82_9ACTN|nr:DinB family protein [Allostreptomyces psammosilenae]NYI07646.1 putative damage-inducible protein DinB [Allostreptomyces psammosilenae]